MSIDLTVDRQRLTNSLLTLLKIDSPTGRTDQAIDHVQGMLSDLGIETNKTRKGGLLASLEGEGDGPSRALTAHVDTLGAMVKEIKANGRLRMTRLGGLQWPSVEGEACRLYTAEGATLTGSILIDTASAHVYGSEAGERERNDEHMELRLDEVTTSEDETRALGVQVGDFVAVDPKPAASPSGFVRSRFLDDKAGVASLLAAIEAVQANGLTLSGPTYLHISNYEEAGHGAAADLPADLDELVAVDMAAVGDGQESDEHHVTICRKDSGGPYHAGLTAQLRRLAEANEIPYRVDIYPYYRSDGSAHWFAGGSAKVALLGPGVDASHHYERTHLDAMVATTQLLVAYLCHPS
ncbi:MAG: M42 family metallopeptidase [Anaerolineales bacterium]